MGLLDSIIGGLAGGVGNGMRTQAGGGLQGQLLQALLGMMTRRAAQGGGAMGGLGGMLGGMLGGGQTTAGLGGMGGMGALAGLAMVAEKLRQGGLADAVGSWIGTGQNQAVSGQQVQGALGSDIIGELAQQFGISHDEVSGQLAGALPEVVNHVTPDGQWPDAADTGAEGVGGLHDIGDLLRRFEQR